MKRLTSGFLLVLFLLNMLGYYGVYLGARWHNSIALTQQFDRDDLRGFETVTFRVPLALPYQTDSKAFERVNGEFSHDGEVYRLVRQKLVQDTLVIVCVKDIRSKTIDQALTDYVRTFTDNPLQGQGGALKIFSNIIKDYLAHVTTLLPAHDGWSRTVALTHHLVGTPRTISAMPDNPPDHA